MATGRIVRLARDGSHGFVEPQGKAEELYFHWSAQSAGSLTQFAVGQLVSFDIIPDPRDAMRMCAVNVHLI